jgi:excisionase family DNA binding protein
LVERHGRPWDAQGVIARFAGFEQLAGRALYTVPEAMEMLNLSRTVIYEQIRSGRLLTVTQGRRRLVPASSMTAYVDLLVTEAMARTSAHAP